MPLHHPGLIRLAARVIKILKRIRRTIYLGAVWAWRRLMFRTTFIAVTGSVGKTTCKEIAASILRSKFPVIANRGNSNYYGGVMKTVLRVRPWHRFAVIEVGIVAPGEMRHFARALQPDIAIWVSVARTHSMNFGTLEVTAREKSELVKGVRPGGLAVLNDDDPHVAAFRPPSSIRVVYYGSTGRSQFRATSLDSPWPDRLSFTVHGPHGESRRVQTRYIGKHWIGSILPGFAVAAEAGLTLEETTTALASVEPIARRLSAVTLPNGAIILRDEINGSVDTMAAALKVFEEARAPRKMIVMTDVSDSSKKPRTRLRDYGRTAARIANAAMFVGENGEHGARAAVAAGMPPDQVWNYYNTKDAADALRSELRAGDLVLLRGRRVDHLDRIYHSLVGEVTCWKNRCSKPIQCDECREMNAKRPAARSDGALVKLRRLTYQR